jgi:hypothetical protein
VKRPSVDVVWVPRTIVPTQRHSARICLCASRRAGRPVVGITPSRSAATPWPPGVAESYNTAQFLGHLPGQRGGRGPLDIAEGALLLVGESSMIPIPGLVALAGARNAKMVLAGDTG